MWQRPRRATTVAGVLVVVGTVAGALSVVPVLEQPGYLDRLTAHHGQVVRGAVFQAVMVPACAGFAVALHPLLRRTDPGLGAAFVGFRFVAAAFHLVGVVALALLLPVGEAYDGAPAAVAASLEVQAELLRVGRDLVNHVAVIVPLALGDTALFAVLHRRRLVPRWLSGCGLAGAALSVVASVLLLAGAVPVVSAVYLGLNAPLGVQSLVLAGWLVVKGFAGGVLSGRSSS
ncbi:hypothetical protein N868_07010 [Cellulomonas carbonis T26]|uniref:DUF4386 domain-containing protein n=1 Tax=Cellulomonas carbonis T26 TaxID=947969 RepID=A0A0A0BZL5_9CELL|nr:hypothetical protein N868_07010 [Cellulomonas carbonis T26]